MRTSGYVVALGGFALLMAGGLGLGLWLNAGVARMEPGALELDVGPELTAVIVGNSGDDTPDARQVREAAAFQAACCSSSPSTEGIVARKYRNQRQRQMVW